MNEKDRDFLRFLWVSDINKIDSDIVIKRFTSVLFGLSCSPFLMGMTIVEHMKKFSGDNDEVVKRVLKDIYMDDCISGAQTSSKAYELYYHSKRLMKKGGFTLLKWATNDDELMQKIRISEKNDYETECGEYEERKVLGVTWRIKEDEMTFSMGDVVKMAEENELPTKRFILKVVASVFDPLGVLSPIVIKLKCLMQQVCQMKAGWDEQLNDELRKKWNNILKGVSALPPCHVSRNYLQSRNLEDVESCEIHGFCDASGTAYAAE